MNTSSHWERIGKAPHHGINLPLSALHSEKSCGIGEFLDLLPLIEWCHEIGMNIIQLLPLNDSGEDSSPYNACSSCALHPIYLSLRALPFLEEYPHLEEQLSSFIPLNKLPRIDYPTVLHQKRNWLRAYFNKTASAHLKNPEFTRFIEENSWIEGYALFKVLREEFSFDHWEDWPLEFKNPNPKEYALLVESKWEEMCFHVVLQYLCFQQLTQVRTYAEEKKIFLLGDIPILISPDSADVWREPFLFDLTQEAGAPPDMYIQEGQNWGLPLFNWEEMKTCHYTWWKNRLTWATHFFHLYRIDHAVGFFRIWGIPKGAKAATGKFFPQDTSLWGPLGEERLKMMLHASPMLPIAEDLGTVPPIAHTTLAKLGICGIKVLRWERCWNEGGKFIPTEEYPPFSLTTVSTHDSETLSLWWRDSRAEAELFAAYKQWHYTPDLTQEQRITILQDSHKTPSIFHINLLQEYLACFPELVANNPQEERINIPGTVLPTNWTYRFRPSLEEMLHHPYLTPLMKRLHAP